MTHLWLRAETKKNEERSALTPSVAKTLMENGDSLLTQDLKSLIGCTIAESGSWRSAPLDAYIIGLKELPENDDSPLPHTHIMFAHCYKNQEGWKDVLSRFVRGKGLLLDLEFLMLNGRRVAAYGYYAGFAGSAVALDVWAHQILNPGERYPKINSYPNEPALIEHTKELLHKASAQIGRTPKVMVMGAKGRCGTGAGDFARRVGINKKDIIEWDMEETKKGGPFYEILESDIFVNCIYLSSKIPPFLTKEMLDQPKKLTVISDVSCDATNPNNPIPVYFGATTFDDPLINIKTKTQDVDVIAIDHLPSLLPREASDMFAKDLLNTLLQLPKRQESVVWSDAEKLFNEKVKLL
ncbi:Saccharopine dehydrogenase [Boothiomyces macroporosus]|uniref:Saccharopine dehydrogenase [NAD(+), L-lysine-forming] n=1 Tax=Boothiomyces macroporosus TaxID=261099 RepID=A0AAD5U9P5_9FUNG|nr:Saccharopine dehydrogenase [Boothiomyces macroporosus]